MWRTKTGYQLTPQEAAMWYDVGRSSVITEFLWGIEVGRGLLVRTWVHNSEKAQHGCSEDGEGTEK